MEIKYHETKLVSLNRTKRRKIMISTKNNLVSSLSAVKPRYIPLWPLWLSLAVATSAMIYSSFILPTIPDFARLSTIGLDSLSLFIAIFVMPKNFSIGFLLSLLPFVISWRVAAIHDSFFGMASSTVVFILYILLYIDCVATDFMHVRYAGQSDRLQWQVATVRIYFGFDMVGHFAEKLFAGSDSFVHMSKVFVGFGLSSGGLAVIVAGLCELAIAIGIGMGFLTRLAGVGAALYYLIANHYGRHFEDGFTWNNAPVGGWEYPMLMIVFFASFAIAGAGRFSIDEWLIEHNRLPRTLRRFCVSTSGETPGS